MALQVHLPHGTDGTLAIPNAPENFSLPVCCGQLSAPGVCTGVCWRELSHWLAPAGPPKWLLPKDWLLLMEEDRKGPPMLEPGVAGGVAAGVAKGVAAQAAGCVNQDLPHPPNSNLSLPTLRDNKKHCLLCENLQTGHGRALGRAGNGVAEG